MPLRSLFTLFLLFGSQNISLCQDNRGPIAMVIHGGAGTILKESFTEEMESEYLTKLKEALLEGYRVLDSGGTALQAVMASVIILENSPLFNAGKGAVFNHDGIIELDAAIMDGSNRGAGAVACVTTVKNPILAAYAVMTKTPHVFLSGKGADYFARSAGAEIVDPSYFFTESRYKSLLKARESEEKNDSLINHSKDGSGTVGAVALDRFGNIAAATSTGGMTNKRSGRIGDTPVIGAGTYADNHTCAVSATGHGEFFIRNMVAYDIAAKMKYLNLSLEEAATRVVMKELPAQGGSGGIIGIDSLGNIALKFNTPGMYRGYIREGEPPKVFIFGD